MLSELALEFAVGIGRQLVREAIWVDDKCSWIGLRKYGKSQSETCAFVLGADLYEGTAGVGYFLSELYAATKDAMFRNTAIGSLHRSLDGGRALLQSNNAGLFDGVAGIVFACFACNSILQDRELQNRAAGLMEGMHQLPSERCVADVISGLAGLIAVELYLLSTHKTGTERVVALGDRLLNLGTQTGACQSWPAGRSQGSHLTGYAHGAAGISSALLALYNCSGLDRFRAAALRGFEFERRNYDHAKGNWVDLRLDSGGSEPRFPNAWCHGAAGIFLSRLRACDVLSSEILVEEREAAKAATLNGAWHASRDERFDSCLCHGMVGLIAILGSCAKERDDVKLLRTVEALTELCFAARVSTGFWPNGLSDVEMSPQLMTGAAGVGHGLLQTFGHSKLPLILDINFRRRG
jgi:lantibiotic modifying enzyme